MNRITTKDVAGWLVGKADDQVRQLIEDEIKQLDSKVRDYLEWMHDPQAHRSAGRPVPQLLREHLESLGSLSTDGDRDATEVDRSDRPKVGPHTSQLLGENPTPPKRDKT